MVKCVAGGGAVEAALSIHLENFATTLGSREQLAIAEFADALLVIPKTLAINAAKDATELVAKLRGIPLHRTVAARQEAHDPVRPGPDQWDHPKQCRGRCAGAGPEQNQDHPGDSCTELGRMISGQLREPKQPDKAVKLLLLIFPLCAAADGDKCLVCWQFATEAAITVLRIDDMITLEKGQDKQYEIRWPYA